MTNQNQAGTKLCGRFVLIEKLGAGGYGEVWRARDELRDTDIALKVLYSQFANSEPAWEVFQREFTLTARLNHPGVLRVFEPVRGADATVLPMVLATGGDLRQMRGASYTKILPMLIDIAAALEHAHARRIVHRDLKPSNVLLDGAGRPLLADFGAGASEGDNTSGPPGSPFSASPQQLAGEPARPADDIYGLGALAYELLSGYPPFYPAFDARKIATEPVPRLKPVKPIPPRLELLVSWLLAKQGRERPPSMRHVADEMNAVLQDTLGLEGNVAETDSQSEAAILWRRRGQPHARGDGGRGRTAGRRRRCANSRKSIPACCRRSTSCARRSSANSARAIAAAAGPSPRAWWWSRAPRRISCCRSSRASRRSTSPRSTCPRDPPTPTIDAEKKAEELATQHAELAKRVLDLDSRAAAQWGGADFAAARKSLDEIGGMLERRKYETAQAPVAALDKALTEIEARVPAALAAQISEGKRALTAGEFENSRQAYETALKIEPGNNEATEGLAKVAAASGVVPTLADAENAENAKDWPKAQTLFADVLKRNPGNVAATEGLARVRADHGRQRIQRHDGRGPRGAERRPACRSPHAPRKGAAHAPGQHRSSRRTAAGRGYRLGSQSRGARAARGAPGQRGTLDRGAGHLRRSPRPRSFPAVRHRRPCRPWRRARNSANGCRHSSTGRSAWRKRRCGPKRSACWRGPKALPSQGPVIRSQVSRLELLLPTFNQPVMLALESDNATEVAIQRVGFFGAFERREVTLKPGKYTVTGKRSGFPRRAPRDHGGARPG